MHIHLILERILKKFQKGKKISLSLAAKNNLLKLQNICNAEFSNQRYYGNDALNRMILLDGRIAELLTPETILAIFSLHVEESQKYRVEIKRSNTFISLAAAIYYGFKADLDTLQFMPNNQSDYSVQKYNQQKQNFQNHTQVIIKNILKAGNLLGIDIEEEKESLLDQKEEETSQSLTALFDAISRDIDKVKQLDLKKELLHVPGYSMAAIEEQSTQGFITLCDRFHIFYRKVSPSKYVILPPATLEKLIGDFLKSPDVLLDGEISHIFYDRVHLEACIVSDVIFEIAGKAYKLQQILREMVVQCEKMPSTSVAQEQFRIRLKLVEFHLKQNFKDKIATEAAESVNNKSRGYYFLLAAIVSLENEICWASSDTIKQQEKRNFYQAIIAKYDKYSGGRSLIECAKECPGFSEHMTEALFENLCQNKMQKLIQGPRNRSEATVELQTVVDALLAPHQSQKCGRNLFNELEVTVDDRIFNITQLLIHEADFQQITLTDHQLEQYAIFMRANERYGWTDLAVLESKDKADFHKGEKMAVKLYTDKLFYLQLQNFLRANATDYPPRSTPIILLTIAVAAHALSKLSKTDKQAVYRFETGYENNRFGERVSAVARKEIVVEKGFISTTGIKDSPFRHMRNVQVIFSGADKGRNIAKYSACPEEDEYLFAPGTQVLYTDHAEVGRQHFFHATVVRSLDRIPSDNYAFEKAAIRHLEVCEKKMADHMRKNKHGSVRRLFDRVDNDEKLSCVNTPLTLITEVLAQARQGNLQLQLLEQCKTAIEGAIQENNRLATKAKASPGKTDVLLEYAKIRISNAMLWVSKRDEKHAKWNKEGWTLPTELKRHQ